MAKYNYHDYNKDKKAVLPEDINDFIISAAKNVISLTNELEKHSRNRNFYGSIEISEQTDFGAIGIEVLVRTGIFEHIKIVTLSKNEFRATVTKQMIKNKLVTFENKKQ